MNTTGLNGQISILFDQGNTPEQISEILDIDLDEVLLVLNGLGKLTKKKIEQNLSTAVQKLTTVNEDPNTCEFVPIEEPDKDTAEAIYKRYHKLVAQRICSTAMSDPDEFLPASVILKAQLYVNEEATGRNEARAKKQSAADALLLTIADMTRHARLANEKMMRALQVDGNIEKQLPAQVIEVGK